MKNHIKNIIKDELWLNSFTGTTIKRRVAVLIFCFVSLVFPELALIQLLQHPESFWLTIGFSCVILSVIVYLHLTIIVRLYANWKGEK